MHPGDGASIKVPRDSGHRLGIDLDDVAGAAQELMTRLATAVPSLLGLTLTMVDEASEGNVDLCRDRCCSRPTHLAPVLGPSAKRRGSGAGAGRGRAGVPTEVGLDEDLPGSALVQGMTGLDRRLALARAEGVRIDRAVPPGEAAQLLRQLARDDSLDLHSYARRLLDACVQRP